MTARKKNDIVYVFSSAELPTTTEHGLTLYKSVLVLWDEDRDTRILDWTDSLDDEIRGNLLIAYEHEAGLALRWKEHVPENYEEGVQIEVGNDLWYIYDSRALTTSIPRHKDRLF